MPGGCQACILPDSYGVPGAPGLGGVVLHISCTRSTSQPTDFTFSIGRCEVERKAPIQAKPAWMGHPAPANLWRCPLMAVFGGGRIGLFFSLMAEKCIRRQNLGCGFRGERLRIGGLEVVLRPSPISEVKSFSPTFASQHSIMHSENKLCAITPRRD